MKRVNLIQIVDNLGKNSASYPIYLHVMKIWINKKRKLVRSRGEDDGSSLDGRWCRQKQRKWSHTGLRGVVKIFELIRKKEKRLRHAMKKVDLVQIVENLGKNSASDLTPLCTRPKLEEVEKCKNCLRHVLRENELNLVSAWRIVVSLT